MVIYNSYMDKINIARNQGFTIIELLVVIAIIGILAAITLVSYTGVSRRATAASMQSDLSSAQTKINLYYTNNSVYPTSIDGSYCPSPADTLVGCLEASSNNTLVYSSFSPYSSYVLTSTNGTTKYRATNSLPPAVDSYASNANWIAGTAGTALAGMYVRSTNLGLLQFKTSFSAIVWPQGSVGGDPSYPTKISLIDPQVNTATDFTEYPAQNACKALGGRLPDKLELQEIYNGRVTTYGNNFSAVQYWSATTHSTDQSYSLDFSTGTFAQGLDTWTVSTHQSRCVAG